MSSTKAAVWECDRGTRAKLEVLQRYLGAWFNILAVHGVRDVIYFDSFCGPGEYEDGTRGSPVIAAQLANSTAQKFSNFRVHMICLDKNVAAVRHLRGLRVIQNHHSRVLIDIRVGEFARQITEIVDSSQYDKRWPIFSFVDPFGFSDFTFSTLQALMRNQSSEIFINLFCGFMNRFVKHPDEQVRQGINGLIGSENLGRVEALRSTPAAVRFVSFEPLIGPISDANLRGVHWAIVGGESGPRARPVDKGWVRRIRQLCRQQDVAFFFKQWGGSNKKRTGRRLDGRLYDEYPAPALICS